MIQETKLRKNNAGYYKDMGDGLGKIKVDTTIDLLEQITALFHEYGHFVFDVFKFSNRKGKRISDKEEETICYEIGDAVEKIFKKYFEAKR